MTDFIDEAESVLEDTGLPVRSRALPVHIVSSESERVSPEFCGTMTWPVPQANTGTGLQASTQIVTRRIFRYKAKLLVIPGTGCTAIVLNNIADRLTLPTPQGYTAPVANFTTSQTANGSSGAIAALTAGSISLPANSAVTAFAITLSTVGTANMVVTLSNVQGGPYVYNIPAGQSQLVVSFPTPLQANGAPQLAWSSTAAAVGNANLNGQLGTTLGVPFFLPEYDSMQPLFATAIGGTAQISVLDESYGELAGPDYAQT
jgi:hypothetical protein